MKKILLFSVFVLFIHGIVKAQCSGTVLTVNNPSFEGTPQPHVTPPGWDICMPGLTPDTQPGSWGVTLPASNGSSYIGLVYAPSINYQEGAGQTLSSAMVAGTTYNFTIDLATPASADPITAILLPPWCDQLQLWGGMAGVNSGCDMSELLWTSPTVLNTTWQTYPITFTPTSNWNHILFLIYTPLPACTDGQYIMMDNMTPVIPVSDIPAFNWSTITTDACAGEIVNFHDASTSTEGTILTWAWNFDDGTNSTQQNPTHTFTTPGTYDVSLTITSSVPCTTNIVNQVIVYEEPTVTVSGGGSLCAGGATTAPVVFTFTGLPPWSVTYTDGTTPVTVNGINTSPYTINTSTAGVYTATSVSNSHCPGATSGSATVNVNSSLTLTATATPPIVCLGSNSTLTVSGANSYVWMPGSLVGSSATVAPLATTTYSVTGTTGACTGSTTVTVTIATGPVLTISGNPDHVCIGDTSQLTVTGGSQSYIWSPSTTLSNTTGTTTTAFPIATTTYSVTGDYFGCISTAEYTLVVSPFPTVDFTSDVKEGCQGLTVHFQDLTTPAVDQWFWTFGDHISYGNTSSLQNPVHYYGGASSYDVSLSVVTVDGCKLGIIYPGFIITHPIPVANFAVTPDIVNELDPMVWFTDQSVGASIWNWNFGDLNVIGDNSTLQNPTHIYSDTGTFYPSLVVFTDFGCTDTAERTVIVEQNFAFYVPNAFTPNDDGKNQNFAPKGEGLDVATFEMRIYDRWGHQVFYTQDMEKGWDGTIKNKIAPEGVFSYLITFSDFKGIVHSVKGFVTLIK
ncbi:MAG: PKD domain-containing protein [Bacteroidota bacterium]